ncbi:hypothetical protein QYF61_022157 [Mycteria americana]|uniref:Uncharacterized protein n=1 Tax=Mycteria americana TaxID=33587 RepID=A0AAN7MQ17_MYCAM|nr:hypothetical protein QYF61_022157 [Mycteria americana]
MRFSPRSHKLTLAVWHCTLTPFTPSVLVSVGIELIFFLGADNAAERGNQPVSVSVTPIHKKKSWKQKSARLEREDERAGPSQGEEEEELVDEVETTRSLSLSELRDMRKDFSCRPGVHIVTWLLRCWDSGASSLELEAMKERYPFKEDVVYRPGKWTTMEKGIQYLRELAMLEVIYGDLDDEQIPTDADEVQCT